MFFPGRRDPVEMTIKIQDLAAQISFRFSGELTIGISSRPLSVVCLVLNPRIKKRNKTQLLPLMVAWKPSSLRRHLLPVRLDGTGFLKARSDLTFPLESSSWFFWRALCSDIRTIPHLLFQVSGLY